MKNLILFSAFCVLTFSIGIRAQDVPQNWVRIESKSKDFSIALPEGEFLVDHDGTKSQLWYNRVGGGMSVQMNRVQNAKEAIRRSPVMASASYKPFESGDFIGVWTDQVIDRGGRHSYWVNLASSKGSYLIVANVKKGDEAAAERFLRSIRVEGRPFLETGVVDPPEVNTMSIGDLETSERIKDALNKPEPKDLKLEIDTAPGPFPNPYQYTRGALIVRRPNPTYTPDARRRHVSGSLLLRVTLLADGTIGSIVLTRSLDKDLDQQAFEAARRIKFIPAEMDGKPVDTVVQVSYGFSIY